MKSKAFTLLELLVVLALMSFIILIVLPGSINQVKGTSVDSRASELVSQIYTYQQNAYSGLANKSFGIKFGTTSYTIFTGTSYATSDTHEDINLDSGITISNLTLSGGVSEIVFSPGSLKPSANGSWKIGDVNATYQININKEGYIEYSKV